MRKHGTRWSLNSKSYIICSNSSARLICYVSVRLSHYWDPTGQMAASAAGSFNLPLFRQNQTHDSSSPGASLNRSRSVSPPLPRFDAVFASARNIPDSGPPKPVKRLRLPPSPSPPPAIDLVDNAASPEYLSPPTPERPWKPKSLRPNTANSLVSMGLASRPGPSRAQELSLARTIAIPPKVKVNANTTHTELPRRFDKPSLLPPTTFETPLEPTIPNHVELPPPQATIPQPPSKKRLGLGRLPAYQPPEKRRKP